MLYKDYFAIDEKYKPVMTREEFAQEPKKWLGFYPHPSFVTFLSTVLEQMDRCKKSIWLTGAYGTGKTYAALVLQKLFNDTDENVDEWFAKRKEQFPSDTIKRSLQKLRLPAKCRHARQRSCVAGLYCVLKIVFSSLDQTGAC